MTTSLGDFLVDLFSTKILDSVAELVFDCGGTVEVFDSVVFDTAGTIVVHCPHKILFPWLPAVPSSILSLFS